ncbi:MULTISPECIES: GNAT family N-acetyltransferase [Clostridium]|uniref:Acetyltransferase, GNAT family n=1 Tax=Clostridium novyi (strain NT) TaxID=386415 RepID=A0Q1L9_CLONN|nr:MULTISPECIES: GNAT family N-acetyltransferase [Clostridium]ABK62230.1 acetyltransferase, GNAT family [Clostridium novyi NT]KEH88245.1 GNAT family acetyltransferase [Clostridium novyi A str. NCTC 538]KEH89444.1 GNAT family acetyltransferase [Clostridium novyi A str. 4540]KEH91364.1 GNAT family acetyltransferase [Clostridium novyi A str. BKT29909]KEH92220.1 GNAT family acetyltransferase [Clostridium novyi A str. GD211209]
MINNKGTIILETERLILRKFEEDDAMDMYENWASDTEVTKYLTWETHRNVEDSKEIINLWIKDYHNKEVYQWAIQLKDSNEIIGSISLLNVDDHNENCELGYCIGRLFWNKGLVTEAALAVIEFAFNDVGFKRIAARHDIDNPASGRVMEKCGLKYEGTLRKILKNNKGQLVDCKYYSIIMEDYFG